MRGLRERAKASSRARREAKRTAKAGCRAKSLEVRARSKALRDELTKLRGEREKARRACAGALEEAAKLREAARVARKELEEERAYRRSMRAITRSQKSRAKEEKRASQAERRGESDDEVRGNIPPSLRPLFERVKRDIRGDTRQSRTEAFLKYAEEHEGEEVQAIEDETERMIRAHELELAREVNPSRTRRLEAALRRRGARVQRVRGGLMVEGMGEREIARVARRLSR